MIVFSRVNDHNAAGTQAQGRGWAVLSGIEEIEGLSIILRILLFGGSRTSIGRDELARPRIPITKKGVNRLTVL